MQKLFKSFFFIYFVIRTATGSGLGYLEVCVALAIAASVIMREKYLNSPLLMAFEFVAITYGMTMNPYFAAFFGILCYDLVAERKYIGILAILASLLSVIRLEDIIDVVLVIGICGLLSYMNSDNRKKGEQLKESFDKERKYNYELEQSKHKLVVAAEESAHIAEVKERNRIARELHDNIGHSLAGVLMILQAAVKLADRDPDKSRQLLDQSITSLSDSLTMVKNTVYNIKPKMEYGINHIEEIIHGYGFCPVDFKHVGNFNDLTASQLELIGTNIKEALTNTSKYSGATKVFVTLEKNSNFIRLMIKDNGKGCAKIKDSLGLSGMKERIKNIGGSISISGDNGFTIVCIIPLSREVGEMLESSDSR